jgi:uncharacterized membrane protein
MNMDDAIAMAGGHPDKMTSVSQLKPQTIVGTNVSGKTYISDLQRQLIEEREARKKLENDLEELRKISSEITSQLSAMQRQQQMLDQH